MNEVKLVDAQKDLIRKWQLALPENNAGDSDLYETLLQALKKRVLYLLEHNYTKLINALYRMDVPEHESAAAFGLQKPEAIAEALSEVILKRELQKMVSRRQKHEEIGGEANLLDSDQN